MTFSFFYEGAPPNYYPSPRIYRFRGVFPLDTPHIAFVSSYLFRAALIPSALQATVNFPLPAPPPFL